VKDPEYIVAEITKNWRDGRPETPGLISRDFEQVIEVNRRRGYVLHKMTLSQYSPAPGELIETIIAVFHDPLFNERN
jgi:hypothetical protein